MPGYIYQRKFNNHSGGWDPTDTVKMLIECGADTEMRNRAGKTPRDVALNEEIKSLFEEFIQKEDEDKKRTPSTDKKFESKESKKQEQKPEDDVHFDPEGKSAISGQKRTGWI